MRFSPRFRGTEDPVAVSRCRRSISTMSDLDDADEADHPRHPRRIT